MEAADRQYPDRRAERHGAESRYPAIATSGQSGGTQSPAGADRSDLRNGLAEEAIEHVEQRGIEVGGDWYFHPDLVEYITGPEATLRADLVIRYCSERLAEGTLNELHVYRVDARGLYHEVCTCRPWKAALRAFDLDKAIERRRKKLEHLAAQLSLSDEERASLRAPIDRLEELRDARG